MSNFQFLNTSGQLVPAGGLVRITGIDQSTGYVTIDLPDADSAPGLAVVGDFSVPLSLVGEASFDALCPRLSWDLAGGVPDVGDTLGSQTGSFLALMGNKGFRCLGGSGDNFTNAVKVDSDTVTTSPGAPGNYKRPVRIATDTNVNLATGLVTGTNVNGTIVATGDRVLVRCQTTTTQNGVYDVPSSGAASRSSDMATAADLVAAVVPVQEGDTTLSSSSNWSNTLWKCNFTSTSVLGSDTPQWALIGGNKSVAGASIILTFNLGIPTDNTIVQAIQFTPPTTGRYRLTANLMGEFILTVAGGAAEIVMLFRDSTTFATLSGAQIVVSGSTTAGSSGRLRGSGSTTSILQLTKGNPVEIAVDRIGGGANPYGLPVTYSSASILAGSSLNWENVGE